MPLNVKIYAHQGNALGHQLTHAKAMQQGLARHGIEASLHQHTECHRADLSIFWGHRRHQVIAQCHRDGSDYLVMERGYLGDRFKWTSLGYNGLNGRAEFHTELVPADRRRQWLFDLKDWKLGGDYVLLCGQVAGDASLAGVDYLTWLRSIPLHINGLPVRFRPHPLGSNYTVPHPHMPGGTTLTEDLQRAAGVICWNSNSSVEAVMAGVPVYCGDAAGSMVGHTIASPQLGFWRRPCRLNWLRRLAYCQWTIDEIANGTAWDHLRKRYA